MQERQTNIRPSIPHDSQAFPAIRTNSCAVSAERRHRINLYEGDSELQYWLSREPSQRVAAVEVLRQ